jgi:hypothetical protein
MLVVLADYSDDGGNSYPAVATLAKKCRMTTRNGNYILSALQATGELRVLKNEGPRGTNRYRIMLDALGAKPLKPTSPLKGASPLKPTSPTPEAGFPKPLKPTSDEPSLNRQEPSDTSLARPAAKISACPFPLVIDSYHRVLPELPRVKLLDSKSRKDKLTAFWRWVLTSTKADGTKRATGSAEALAWIETYFERARSNDFLMGRTGRSSTHENWRCDLDFLLSERGKTQVIEKTEAAG